ncbi:lipocalin-like [Periophthalmus magnuspinnatus]|uniref:lipocalin-like n=1 Tax=Periophthalmus magnuspinnatus TaxID=409849 RepID=UPI00145A5D30|nr:lipocalin-like [Periophthalmus magnuspinnatus]
MENMLLRMLGVLLCALAACAEIAPAADFDLAKVAGKWYTVGFASNSEWCVNHRDTMKMGSTIITPTETGNLKLSFSTLKSDGSCLRATHVAKKTDTPGRFIFHSEVWNNDMRVVEVVYDNYALVHIIKTKNGVQLVLNKLYSRTTQASNDLQQKFRQFSLDTGVLAENILILPPNDDCPTV